MPEMPHPIEKKEVGDNHERQREGWGIECPGKDANVYFYSTMSWLGCQERCSSRGATYQRGPVDFEADVRRNSAPEWLSPSPDSVWWEMFTRKGSTVSRAVAENYPSSMQQAVSFIACMFGVVMFTTPPAGIADYHAGVIMYSCEVRLLIEPQRMDRGPAHG